MANWNLYTEKDDQFLIDNCINGDMTYKEAADRLGRSNAGSIGVRVRDLRDIHNFKKNTVQKYPVKKTEPELVEFRISVNEIAGKAEPEAILQSLPEIDELESIPYVDAPIDNSFGEAVHIASVLSDVFHDEIGYFSFNKYAGFITIEIGNKRVSVSEISDDSESQ